MNPPSSKVPVRVPLLILAAVPLLIGAVIAWRTLALVWTTHTPMIHGDGFSFLAAYADYLAGKTGFVEYFWRQHTEHRIGVARILFALDAEFFGGTQVLEKSVAALLIALTAALFIVVVSRRSRIATWTRLLAAGFMLVLFASNQKMEVLMQNFTDVFATFEWFSVAAFFLTAIAIRYSDVPRGAWLLGVACICGFCAAYSYAPGLWACPIMAVQCAWFRKWRFAAIALAAGLAIGASYLWQIKAPAADPWTLFKQPIGVAHYVLAYIGSPVAPLGLTIATLVGALLVGLLIYHVIRASKFAAEDKEIVSFLFAVCALGLVTALLTSLGRLQLGLAYALSSRYSSLAEPIWAALLVLGLLRLEASHSDGPPAAATVAAATGAKSGPFWLMGAMCMATVGMQGFWSVAAGINRDQWEMGATAVIADVPDNEALTGLGPLEATREWTPYAAERRWSVFRSDADTFLYRTVRASPKAPVSAIRPLGGTWCKGDMDLGRRVPDPARHWHVAAGYAVDHERQMPVDGILFAGKDNKLVGVGRPIAPRRDIDLSLNLGRRGMKLHYFGYAEKEATAPVSGYAFRLDRDSLCKIGER